MAFGGAFQGAWRPAFDAGGAAAVPWWLSGGMTAAQCVGAYLAKGAADLATSLINLNSPGTYNLAVRTGNPTFGAGGWTGVAGCTGLAVSGYTTSGGVYSVAVRVADTGSSYQRYVECTPTANYFTIQNRGAGSHAYYIGTSSGDKATGNTAVFILVSQSGTDQETAYRDAVSERENWTTNVVGDGEAFVTINTISNTMTVAAVAWYFIRLSVAQVAALTTAMAAL